MLYFGGQGIGALDALWKVRVKNNANRFLFQRLTCLFLFIAVEATIQPLLKNAQSVDQNHHYGVLLTSKSRLSNVAD